MPNNPKNLSASGVIARLGNYNMAEILVKAVDHIHPDKTEDMAGSYKSGMPVVVMPDGHRWGRKEGPPNFVIIKMPGVSFDDLKDYTMSETIDVAGKKLVTRRRRWKIRFNNFSEKAKKNLMDFGRIIIRETNGDMTKNDFSQYFHDQKTGLDGASI